MRKRVARATLFNPLRGRGVPRLAYDGPKAPYFYAVATKVNPISANDASGTAGATTVIVSEAVTTPGDPENVADDEPAENVNDPYADPFLYILNVVFAVAAILATARLPA